MENEKLIDAIKIIREECRSQQICERCPMYSNTVSECALSASDPAAWKFKEEIDQIIFI